MPAYKEKGINKVLNLLLNQSLSPTWKLYKIFVVACGYENFDFLKSRKIEIIKEKKRSGKAYAMDLALKKIRLNPKINVVVVHNADVFPKKNMLRNLLEPFHDHDVGMTCVRPVSLDDSSSFLGFLNNLVWELHHFVSLVSPKVGEVFAFRNIVKRIPKRLAADEAYVESIIRRRGYRITYVPNAMVSNKGPKNISEFVRQRRRFFTGHVHIKNKYGYKVSTMSVLRIIKATYNYLKITPPKHPKKFFWLMLAMFLESYARLLGTIDFYFFKKVPYSWKIIKSAK